MAAKREYSTAVQQKREAMIEQIIVAATRRLNRQGFSNATMEDVARDVNLLPGALYHYVHDKDDLAFLCFERGCDLRRRQLEAADERGVEGLEKIRRYLRSVLKTGQSRMPVFNEVNALTERRRDEIRLRIRQNNDLLRRYLSEGMADGSVAPSDPSLTALAVIGVVDWISFWYSARLGYAPEQAALLIDDVLTHGIYRRDLPVIQFPETDEEAFPSAPAFAGVAERRRDDILRAAMQAFNRYGFPGASVDQIAVLAQVTRATVYRYFENKEELLFHSMRRADAFIQSAVDKVPTGRDVIDQEVWLRRFLFHGHATEAGPLRTYALLNSLPQAQREQLVRESRLRENWHLGRIQMGIEQGYYRRVDPYIAERVRSGLFSWFPVWFREEGPRTAIEIADHHTGLFLYGLKPRSPQTRFSGVPGSPMQHGG